MKSEQLNKRITLLVLGACLLPLAGFAQKRTLGSAGVPTLPEPPGTTRVAENLFMDEAEVANLHWLEYLYFLRRDSTTAVFQAQLPDSTGWKPVVLPESPTSSVAYFRAPAYRFFPATGISYEQAQAYCRWRSTVVNQGYFQSPGFRKQHPELRDYVVRVQYRLPTEAEWEQAAAGNLPPGPRPFELIQTKSARKSKPQQLAAADDLVACLEAQRLPHPAAEVALELPFNLERVWELGRG